VNEPAPSAVLGRRPPSQMLKAFRLHGLKVGELPGRLYHELDRDNALGLAAELAFFTLLSVFPFLIFLLTLIAYLPVPNLAPKLMTYMSKVVPADALRLLEGVVLPIVARQRADLLTISFIFSIWSASTALGTLMGVMNHAYDVPETRSWFWRKGVNVAMTIGLSIFIILALALVVLGHPFAGTIARLIGAGEIFAFAWYIGQWPIAFILLSFALAVLYYASPNIPQRWHWITPGSVLGALLWIAFSEGFAYYVRNFGSYNKIYGSIGAVVVLMLWLYVTALAVIIGGELNAIIDQAAAKEARLKAGHP